MSGVEGLQQVGGFAAAHLADDDVIGSVPQGVAHEVADTDRPLLHPARLESDAVRRINPQLERVLDGDDPLVVGEQLDEGVQERGLTAPGAAAHEDIPAGVQHPLGLLTHVLGERALRHELRGRVGAFPKPPHGNGDGGAGGRNADRHARAVVQARIKDRNDSAPKSAVELAMERLRKKDAEAGVSTQPITDEQRAAIAEVRSLSDSKIAEQDILQQSAMNRLLGADPVTAWFPSRGSPLMSS